jgi:hypothetical protein
MHSGQAQAEQYQCQNHTHYRAIPTYAFSGVWTMLHTCVHRVSLLYPFHLQLHALHLDLVPPR